MALEPLATVDDLAALKIDTSDAALVTELLAAASSAVREAAGSPITQGTWTLELPGDRDRSLRLPAQPVVSVDAVLIDDREVTDWRLVGGQLWRAGGWSGGFLPSLVTVTYTAGLPSAPPDIVNLVCSMVGAALTLANESGYESRGDVVSERVDDYSVQYASDVATRSAGPLELPPLTVERLRNRFGGGATVVSPR